MKMTPTPHRFQLSLVLAWLASAGLVPLAAQEGPSIIDTGRYDSDAAAQAAWQPMAGTAPALAGTWEGTPVLRMRCNFADTQIERASWDRRVQLNLDACRGVQFEFHCREATPVSYFSLYFQSGDGWYTVTFFPETAGWNRITIDKSTMRAEGRPAGWGTIRTIRLSAWRGADADTEFYLRDFRKIGVLGVDTLVALLRCDSAAQNLPAEAASAQEWCGRVARRFEESGIGCATVSDIDLSEEILRRAKLIVLPHNPTMPDATATALVRRLQDGGRLLAFYGMPARLRPAVHIEAGPYRRPARPGGFAAMKFDPQALPGAPAVVGQNSWNIAEPKPVPGASRMVAEWLDEQGRPTGFAAVVASSNAVEVSHVLLDDDAANKRQMLLAVTGYLVPEIWQRTAEAGLARIGLLAGFRNSEEAAAGIARTAAGDVSVLRILDDAQRLRTATADLIAAGRFAEACAQAREATQRMLEAFASAQRPLPSEFRAFWCHSAFGVEGLAWEAAIQRLAENGFTAILPNMLWGGVAYYPSKVLPVAPEVARQGDQIARCLEACRKHGLQMHVWKVNWNLGAAPRSFLERMRLEKRLQSDTAGREEPWLCPSHPDNHKLEIDSMVEVVRAYGVDGIHFDYIRYPDGDHCFCAGCRERFALQVGGKVERWPQDALPGGTHRAAWLEWRRNNITRVVQAVSEQARAVNPQVKLSAAVFRNWPIDRDGVGQDWKLWCERGYLDFVCPMNYTGSDAQFDNWVTQQKTWAGRIPCYPGIGAWELTPDRVIGQILLSRQRETGGFVVFNYDARAASDLLPLLGRGVSRAVRFGDFSP